MLSTCLDLYPSGCVVLSFSCSELESLCVPSESVGAVEDRKKVPWSDKETIILLEIWGDTQVGKAPQVIRTCVSVELWDISSIQVQRSIRRYPHNGHVFTEISEKLRANGYSRTPEQCHSRIKRLKSNYRQCRESIR